MESEEEMALALRGGGNGKPPRWMIWTGLSLAILAIAALVGADIMMRRAEPLLKSRLIDTLETRFDSRVELDKFRVSVMHGFEVSGSGLRLYPRYLDRDEPNYSVAQFSFRTPWMQLLRTPMHINRIFVSGLKISIPPKSVRRRAPKHNVDRKHNRIKIAFGEMLIEDMTLLIETDKRGHKPLDFDIQHVQLTTTGPGKPLKFEAMLVNAKPVGNIVSKGYFGPFNADYPGETPVQGDYAFRDADLSTTKGIAGILSSNGSYRGWLNNITVDGETDTPDFRLDTSNHPVHLKTQFHAIVDGTNGDTYLEPVTAQFRNTHLTASGKIVRAQDQPGHHITLDVVLDHARIEDLLMLGVKTTPPVMNGAVRMRTSLDLPPGKIPVSEKIRLKGHFDISDALFSSEKIQSRIDELSLRSQGKPKLAKLDEGADIRADISGSFALADRKLSLHDLAFRVPGTDVSLDGTYSLDGKEFDFHGRALLQAKASHMVTGWKALMLKPVDPFLSKDGAGTVVPIKITGTNSSPKIGLDFGHKDSD